jgi:hypothetical protein
LALFRRRRPDPEDVPDAPPDIPVNLLPSDNVYLPVALAANDDFDALGWKIRVAAVRMEELGTLDIALVVPGDEPSSLREGLDAVPGGSNEVLNVLQRRLAEFDHGLHPIYFSEGTWRDTESSPRWQPAP